MKMESFMFGPYGESLLHKKLKQYAVDYCKKHHAIYEVEKDFIDVFAIFPYGKKIAFECQTTINRTIIRQKLCSHRDKVDKIIFVIPINLDCDYKGDDVGFMKAPFIREETAHRHITSLKIKIPKTQVNIVKEMDKKSDRFGNNLSFAYFLAMKEFIENHPELYEYETIENSIPNGDLH